MKDLMTLISFILLGAYAFAQESHSLFTNILEDYVQNGNVNYSGLSSDDRFETYLTQLSETNPDTIAKKNDQLAFWINAYNAFTLKIICDNYPLESIRDLNTGGTIIAYALKKTVWDKDFIVIYDQKMNLNHIEHDIVRPVYDDPRAHFALVCAAVSCPPLRREAYEGNKLNEQLDEQGKIFMAQSEKNYFLVEEKEAYLSKILDWYGKDFGQSDEEILLYLTAFLPKSIADAIINEPKEWDIKHTEYDWSLNDLKK
jgi:hypothetical protein